MSDYQPLIEALPLLIPLELISLGLVALALYDLVRRKRVKGGNKAIWGMVIVLISFIGPAAYLMAGREAVWRFCPCWGNPSCLASPSFRPIPPAG